MFSCLQKHSNVMYTELYMCC